MKEVRAGACLPSRFILEKEVGAGIGVYSEVAWPCMKNLKHRRLTDSRDPERARGLLVFVDFRTR